MQVDSDGHHRSFYRRFGWLALCVLWLGLFNLKEINGSIVGIDALRINKYKTLTMIILTSALGFLRLKMR